MDHIVKKLSEIEHAAEAVVEHAELEKSELEERIQNERNQFDKQLEDHTQKELNDIHKGLNRQMDEILARQNRKNQTAIEELKKDFEEKHTAYAEKIVRRIIEGKLILIAALVLSIFIPFGYYLLGEKNKGRYKCALAFNVLSYFGTFLVAGIMLFGSVPVHAADAAASGAGLATGLGYIAAALVTGLSCIGGGIAVASAASAALGAISEDSSVLGKSLIFVGLAEGVCLYGLIISFMIISRL